MKYTELELELTLTEPMLGTVPKNPEVYAAYIASKAPVPANGEEEVETVPPDVEKSGWTGFHQDEQGLFIYNYMINGFLKEAGTALKSQIGVSNIKSKIDQFVFVEPRRIYLDKEKPDGCLERPLRALTMQGPRVSLARSDYVSEGTKINVTVRVLDNSATKTSKALTAEVIKQLLEYGELKGLGQFRNGCYGRFTAEVK